jgi:hypothetical protein
MAVVQREPWLRALITNNNNNNNNNCDVTLCNISEEQSPKSRTERMR